MSNRTLALLAMVIILLWATQFIFSPISRYKNLKVVDAGAKVKKGMGTKSKPYKDLQYAIDKCDDGDTILVMPGEYSAEAHTFLEDLCGNCQEHRRDLQATRGFLIEGKGLNIIGTDKEKVRLITNAGYGILFLNSRGSTIANVTITGGKRDADGAATDAAIVAKFSSLTIKNCLITDNSDFIDSVIVGIAGIVGREGSNLVIMGSQIINNSWDGIALYRGAEAYITGNTIRQGRGAGIGVTWDASSIITGNTIAEYWKGIGSFGSSQVIVKNNIVHNCLGWGIIASGSSFMDACNNVVYHNGNCGMAAWGAEAHGRFSGNIIALNGWKEQWVAPRVGLQNYGGYQNFEISYNNIWGNEEGSFGGMPDLTGKKGNISCDPKFIDPEKEDFKLSVNSPCIDKGNPQISDFDGSISDIGLNYSLWVW